MNKQKKKGNSIKTLKNTVSPKEIDEILKFTQKLAA
jgi:hypothetical protein